MSTLLIDLKVQDNAGKTLKAVATDTRLLKGEIKNLDTEMKNNGTSTDNLSKKMEKQNQIVGNYETVLNRAKEKQKALTTELKDAKTELERVEKATGGTGEEFEKCSNNVKKLEEKLERQNEAVRKAETDLKGARLEVDKTNKSFKSLADEGLKLTQEKLAEFGESSKKFGSEMKSLAGTFAPFSAAAVGALGISAKAAISFEKQMDKVAAVSNASAQEIELLNEKAKQMGIETPKSATEAGAAFEYMALAGYSVKEMTEAIEPTLQLSVAANLDLARTSDLVTDSMASLGLSADKTTKYLDVVAATTANANTNAEDMTEAYIKAGGTFKNLNVPIEESAYWIGVLADQGYKGEQAGTSLNSIMINLTTGAGKAGKELQRLGISAFDSNGEFKGLTNVLTEVAAELEGATEQQVNQTLALLGGKTQVAAMQKLIGGISGDYGTLKQAIDDSTGALERQYDTMRDNVAGEFEVLKSKAEGLAIQLGDVLLPHISNFVDGLGGMVDGFAALSPEMQNMTLVGLGLVAMLSPALLILGQLATLVGTIAPVIGTAALALGGMNLATGLLIGTVAAAGFGIVQMDQAFKDTTTTLTNNAVYGDINQLVQAMTNGYENLEQAVGAVGRAFLSLYDEGLVLAEQFSLAIQGEDLALTESMKTNSDERTKILTEKENEQYTTRLQLLKDNLENLNENDRARALAEIQILKDTHEKRLKEITVNGEAEKLYIDTKEAQISAIMEQQGISRELATTIYQDKLQGIIEEGYTAITGLTTAGEDTVNGIVERANLNKKNLTTDGWAKEVKLVNDSLDEQTKAVNEGYNAQVLELSKMASEVDEESRGMYQAMLDNLNESKNEQLAEIETLRTESVDTLYQLAEETGVEAKRITDKLNEGLDTKDAQQELKDVESMWKRLEKLTDVTKNFTVRVTTSGNTAAAKAAGFAGFSLTPDMPVTTFSQGIPTGINDIVSDNISNFATNNTKASNIINNISKTVSGGSDNSQISALLARLSEKIDNTVSTSKTEININVENMNANSEQDFYDLVERLNKEFELIKLRGRSMKGGYNVVR